MSTLLRFAGGLHIVAGRVVVEAELDTGVTSTAGCAGRSASCTGTPPTCRCWRPPGLRQGHSIPGADHRRRRPVGSADRADRPARAVRSGGCRRRSYAGSRRRCRSRMARRISRPRLTHRAARRGGSLGGHLPGAGGGPMRWSERRGGSASAPRHGRCRGADRVVVRGRRRDRCVADPDRRPHLRAGLGGTSDAPRGARHREWQGHFDDANLRRSARAAVAAKARVERALTILGDEAPNHLSQAGRAPHRARPGVVGGTGPTGRSADDQGRHRRPHPTPAHHGRQARPATPTSPIPNRR